MEKSAIGIPSKRLKLAASQIYEALTIVFNNSLQLGLCISRCFKISKGASVDKGGNERYKTPAETFSKFPSVLRVIDRSDRNPPITAR